MQDAGDVRRVFVHIGLRKTGTSFLQSHLWGSADLLRERGIRLVPSTRERAVVAMRAARGRLDDAARIQRALAQLRRDAQEAPEPTLLMTQESLAGATTEEAATLLESFVGREVHVVVTARDIARQLPSAWQQRVKAGFDIGFEDYLREVQEAQDDAAQGGGAGRAFWEHQDLVAVLARWSELVTRQRVHVVTVPARDADRRLLPERFGAVLGVDFEELRSDEVRANDSLDPVQVELLRRVNRLQPVQGRRQRADTVKNYFVTDILAPRRSAPARTPRELNDWCLEEGYRQVKALRRGG